MARILVIEDDLQLRRLIVRILKSADHEVIEAANGKEGVTLFVANTPVLIITDILMPEKEGIETIRDLRRRDLSVPIIAISGGGHSHQMMIFLEMATKLGATASLAKPFRPQKLLGMVEALLPQRAEES
jgi:DNA-binding response OmpR family regulator